MMGRGGGSVRTLSLTLFLGAAAFALACSSTTGPEVPDLSGSWTGANEQVGLTLSITEGRFGQVQGTGMLNAGSSGFPVVVRGEHRHPNVSLTLRLSEDQAIQLDGTLVEGAVVTGSLDGVGFDRLAIILSRLAVSGGVQ